MTHTSTHITRSSSSIEEISSFISAIHGLPTYYDHDTDSFICEESWDMGDGYIEYGFYLEVKFIDAAQDMYAVQENPRLEGELAIYGQQCYR